MYFIVNYRLSDGSWQADQGMQEIGELVDFFAPPSVYSGKDIRISCQEKDRSLIESVIPQLGAKSVEILPLEL